MSKLWSGFSYTNVVATLALFVALGGGAYAALRLPRNSVGSTQLKANAVNSSKVKNGSLRAGDFKAGQIPAGPTGEQGLPGAQGVKGDPCLASDPACRGPKGDQGPPATDAAHANSADTATNAGNADMLDNKDSTAFALAGAEPWNTPVLNNPGSVSCHWTNYGGEQNPAGYFRDSAGVVHLRGLVVAADGSAIDCGDDNLDEATFNLPAGYRPDHTWALPTISNNKPGRINVDTAGFVSIEINLVRWQDAQQWVSLDGLTFRCAPSGQDGCP
jgi:hypothetical protein